MMLDEPTYKHTHIALSEEQQATHWYSIKGLPVRQQLTANY